MLAAGHLRSKVEDRARAGLQSWLHRLASISFQQFALSRMSGSNDACSKHDFISIRLPFSRRQQQAMRATSRASLTEFRSAFPGAGNEAEELWKGLRLVAVVDDFCPVPEDDLLEMYGLADEDLDELLVGALRSLGYRVPGPDESKDMAPLRTVSDAVHFLRAWSGK